jgi:sugar phosphate isomerase/epimerase
MMYPQLTRRGFLGVAALTVGSAAFARTSGVRRKMTIDLTPGAIGVRVTPREAIDLAARYGFESVAPDAGAMTRMSDGEIGELVGHLRANNLVFGAAGLPVDFRGAEEKFREDLANLPATAEALRKGGVTRIGTWISPAHAERTYLQNLRLHATRLREVARVLGNHGIRFGLEYVGPKTSWTGQRFPFVHTMAEMKDLIGEIDMPNVGLVLDSWHWYTAGETEDDLLTLSNEEVVAVDLSDAPEGIPVDEQMDLRRRLPATTGVIDLRTFLGALVKIDYDGPVRAEPFDETLRELPASEAAARTAEAMKRAFALIG